jgi:tetrahydromethanopterin S-methyltransferase subunit G
MLYILVMRRIPEIEESVSNERVYGQLLARRIGRD